MRSEYSKEEENRWYSLGESVALAIPYLPWTAAPWLRPATTDADLPARVQAFELIERPHVARIEAAVEQWLRDQKPPVLEEEPMFFFSLRFQVVGSLLMSFRLLADALPYPADISEREIAHRWLIDWWRDSGAFHGVGHTSAEHEGEPN